ncbi:MAG: histidinol-phosphatase [Chloroflexi bacterium]|nr:histidinol-phosphatase [Chloroflexota bacterium]
MSTLDPQTPYATNEEVARALFHVASLFELLEGNVYRVRAYRRAALAVLYLPEPLAEYVARGEELPLPGVGDRIRGKLVELVNTGQMGIYDALLADLGEPMVSLLAIRGVGPKTALRLVRELRIGSLQDVVDAARSGRIRALRGFGPRREEELGRKAEALLLEGAA